LNTTTGGRDETFHGCSVKPSRELLLLGLHPWDDGDSKKLLENAAVKVKDFQHFLVGFCLGEMSGVALLPKEFTGADKRL